ncbi:putative transmembrane protein [Helianthus annuus]|nr:putative transmembrane protein [Helianthus annuus]KAJ0540853.1 putative transmembrane protein [Helianthus annuus]KAJ0705950.1 putative transmembrane protein [Helianthus annuus]KAJ0751929.1 putative transmembrane protein [Helianthus annuus]KAJ0886327.1 putative transmembrane protein [Helianthus annuus]
MSGGTPTGGGLMRQRHSQGYASSGDDLEDDACSSRVRPQSPKFPETRTWVEVLENVLWIASAVFIIYLGDWHSNFIYILFHDGRIKRTPLYLGLFGVSLNVAYFVHTSMLLWGFRKSSERWELSSTDALPYITSIGLVSFCLFCYALWPIWSFLTLPLVFTLFMACMVILPYMVLGTFKQQPSDMFRID